MTFHIQDITQIERVAQSFLEALPNSKKIVFAGEMGAGKTTFIKALCNQLGVTENITSPTFSIVNEYQTEQGDVVYHFDFYRIKNIDEAFDLGYEEYFYGDDYCFVEWPEKIADLIPDDFITAEILLNPDYSRTINVKGLNIKS